MDISTLISHAFTIATPYLVKCLEGVSSSAGKDVWEKIKSVFKAAKQEDIADKLERSPSDKKLQNDAMILLSKQLEQSDSLKQQILELIKIYLDTYKETTISINGNDNIGIAEISNSQLNITSKSGK